MENETSALITEEKPKTTPFIKSVEDVVRMASYSQGLACGLKEAVRAVENREAYFCVLAKDCDVKEYTKLVEALCATAKCDLIVVPSKSQLGEWAGLNKKSTNFKDRKKHNCAFLAIKKIEEESAGFKRVVEQFSKIKEGKRIITIEGEKKAEKKKGKK